MPTRRQIVDYARTLVGIGESPPGSNRNQITEAYGQDAPWCAMYTWYVWRKFGVDLRQEFSPLWASTVWGANAAKSKGLWRSGIEGAQPGDLAYMKLPDGAPGYVNHTGIVVAINGGIMATVEGNTANVCAERRRTEHLVGYIDMSRYIDGTPAVPKPKPSAPPFPGEKAFRIGRAHAAVVQLDRQLIRLGYVRHHNGNGYQEGPRYTKWTRGNVQDFQRDQGWRGPDADGYPGPETWRRLFTTPTPKTIPTKR
ncbi:peptidoglycan-binding protein [Streptomyces sp. NPDC004726]